MRNKADIITRQYTIETKHSAIEIGSGDMPVLSTPSLIAFMENAAMLLAREYTEVGSTTVGTRMMTDHQHATLIGEIITVTAKLSAIDGRKLTFSIEATDQAGIVAQATHERFIVTRKRFLERLGIKE